MAEEFGPYLVYEQLGLGGMASVHRAETRGIAGFSHPVALKRMLPHVAANEELVRSFVREARLASHLRHANVAQTLDLGKVGDTYFIAMELVPGKNLRQVLSHCLRVCGAMPLPIAINIIGQIADALDYAHNLADETGTPLGIIHRDVSPSNVIVSEGGVAKLIDFGIAKASAASMQTMSRTIKGKFGYMAPEYIEGRIDARADLFALGVIAHEMLANRPLFQGTDEMDTLYRVRTMTIEPPSTWREQIPPEIDSIVMTALQRDPSVRWQGAQALRTALTTEAQRLGLVAHGAQVDEWMTWAFQQKAGGLRADTMPEISISESATPTPVAPRPSAPHPRVVQRGSTPPQNVRPSIHDEPTRAVPASDFTDDQRTIARHPSSHPPDTLKTPVVEMRDEPPQRPSTELPHFDDDADTTNERGADKTLDAAPRATLVDAPRAIARKAADAWPADEVAVTTSPARTRLKPASNSPALLPVSGARTAPRLAAAAPAAAVATPQAPVEAPPKRSRRWLLAILLLVAAAVAAAVVYFALPYFT